MLESRPASKSVGKMIEMTKLALHVLSESVQQATLTGSIVKAKGRKKDALEHCWRSALLAAEAPYNYAAFG